MKYLSCAEAGFISLSRESTRVNYETFKRDGYVSYIWRCTICHGVIVMTSQSSGHIKVTVPTTAVPPDSWRLSDMHSNSISALPMPFPSKLHIDAHWTYKMIYFKFHEKRASCCWENSLWRLTGHDDDPVPYSNSIWCHPQWKSTLFISCQSDSQLIVPWLHRLHECFRFLSISIDLQNCVCGGSNPFRNISIKF